MTTARLHDEETWRLPNWEEYSESGRSAWTEGDVSEDSASRVSDEEEDETAWGRRRVATLGDALAMTTTVTTPRRARLDLKALHQRYAQQRAQLQEESKASEPVKEVIDTSAIVTQQSLITTQLASVREQLQDFQQKWQLSVETTAQTSVEASEQPSAAASARENDVQKDLEAKEDALLQWLHLITQKVDVLASSFHHETTQLPIRYPLQPHVPEAGSDGQAPQSRAPTLSSWHVGASLQDHVSQASAERLLDLERSVACLVTATEQTTQRYVSYFEKIVQQIQELHQQRLRQVVEESLQEMKTQRTRYKKRVEQLETECQEAKKAMDVWRERAATLGNGTAEEKQRLEQLVVTTKEQAEVESSRLRNELATLKEKLDEVTSHRDRCTLTIEGLDRQLEQSQNEAREAQLQLRVVNADMERVQKRLGEQEERSHQQMRELEASNEQLRSQLFKAHENALLGRGDLEQKLRQELQVLQRDAEAAVLNRVLPERLELLQQKHGDALREVEENWRRKLQAAVAEARAANPVAQVMNTSTQTEMDRTLDDSMDTEDRIVRLSRRCRALENLLDKKFEVCSVASSPSRRSQRLNASYTSTHSMVSTSRDRSEFGIGALTLPLTDQSSYLADTTFFATENQYDDEDDDEEKPMRPPAWDASSPVGSSYLLKQASTPTGPTTEDVMALVRKLEMLARPEDDDEKHSVVQPDEEPELEKFSSRRTTPRAMVNNSRQAPKQSISTDRPPRATRKSPVPSASARARAKSALGRVNSVTSPYK
ncbi:hypothetical protein Poli38472_012740 [Pythium oligandrum]|uniref:Uncharacterized protein n=1 Tax=Pythium oligandrum TaxID=41045 RepID=A0A8K1CEG9_PYTOL|nr:hypothetical protein Poli38472_012740 [Pythium oligandrum]|eukprot:TMW61549.1 hypothetical protein Poli38472_012740 [Pythium oligandrum]